jgi:acetyl-CoA carboxylase biotin carboxyl carrier protein
MKPKELQELIDFISKSGLDEVNIETEEFKIKVKKNAEPKTRIVETTQAVTPVPQPSGEKPAENATPSAVNGEAAETDKGGSSDSNLITIKSPMIGTYYDAPNPESDAFVSIGDSIKVGDTVCIVEAMKLFNEIESEISGTIVKILVENATPVEYDQPLFLVNPA